MKRRDVIGGAIGLGTLLVTENAKSQPKKAPSLVANITRDGATHTYAMEGGHDLGNFVGKNFVQRNVRAFGPIPGFKVFFRPDTDEKRQEIVFELGKFDPKGDPAGTQAGAYDLIADDTGIAYHVEIKNGDTVLAHGDVANHWWGSRWRWQSAPRPIVNSPAALMAARYLPTYGRSLPSEIHSLNFSLFAYAKPMDSAGVTQQMGQTGDRADIGFIPEPPANWLLNPDDRYAQQAMLAWAEASGSVPWNFRDEITNAPINLTQYPKANTYTDGARLQGTPNFKGPFTLTTPVKNPDGSTRNVTTSGWGPENAHFPALSYVAFLATGDPYFLEGTQFESLQAFMVTAYYSTEHVPHPDISQTRGLAWTMRSLFMARKAADIAEQTGALPGWFLPAGYYKTLTDAQKPWLDEWMNSTTEAATVFSAMSRVGNIEPWQDDFVAFVLGFAVLAGYAEYRPLFQWKLKSTLARTNGKSGWPRAFCSPYYLNLGENWNDEHIVTPGAQALQMAHPGAKYYSSWAEAWKGFYIGDIQNHGNQIDQATVEALASDPDNGGVWAQKNGGDFLLYTRGALVMAVQNGIAEAQEPLKFVDKLVSSIHYMSARWAMIV